MEGEGSVEDLIGDLEAQLSQESEEADVAEACRSSSDDEVAGDEIPPAATTWWVNSILQHTSEYVQPKCLHPLKLISACTGACAEGNVLEVTNFN